jgi:hypothetical protein
MTLESMFTSGMRLSDILRLSMKKSEFDKTPYTFLPQGTLDTLITKATILHAMGVVPPTSEDDELAIYILTKAKRAFATAAYIELQPRTLYNAMVLFRDTGFTDERLPLEKLSGDILVKNELSWQQHPLVNLEEAERSEAKKIWTFGRVHNFLEDQFKFLAPVISTARPDQDFGHLILPFVKKHAAQAEGSFGEVTKYEIHSDHIQFLPRQVRQ